MIGADTVLCISVSARPGRLGAAMHGAGYAALGLDFAYKPFGTDDIVGAIAGVRALGIRGCSVSMPFKESVVALLDELDDRARRVGAVNTVVNEGGTLRGYNTDVDGAAAALAAAAVRPGDAVTLLGGGGAAKAVLVALHDRGVSNVTVALRSSRRRSELEREGVRCVTWDQRTDAGGDLVINATPVGMRPDVSATPLDPVHVKAFGAVIDVVVAPVETRLVAAAQAADVPVVRGDVMTLHQAAAQFRLYTGETAPLEAMERALTAALQE